MSSSKEHKHIKKEIIIKNKLESTGFGLTFQSCIMKNTYKISLVLFLPKCTP